MRRNAKTKKVHIVHGGNSRALRRGPQQDGRTKISKFSKAFNATLVAHVGGDPSAVEAELIELATQDAVLWRIARSQLISKSGRLDPHALDQYLRVQRELRAILMTLGLKQHAREATLQDVLEGEATQGEAA
jgi:hypothetical protein